MLGALGRCNTATLNAGAVHPYCISLMKHKPWTVLVAEDNAVSRHLAVAILEQHGAVVVTAADGRQALEAWAPNRFDVILMDLLMPELDGLEATRLIRAREAGASRVPIIALTARTLPGDREMCEAAGMDDYIAKPLVGDALIQTIERVLQPAAMSMPVQAAMDFDAVGAVFAFSDLTRAELFRAFAPVSKSIH